MHPTLRRRLIIAAALLGVVLAVASAWLFLEYRDRLPPVAEVRERLLVFLQTIPAPLYFLAFAILPALGVPLSLFYLTALPVLGRTHPAIGIVLAWTALAIDMVLANLLARGILHPVIEWVIRHRNLSIPKFKPHNEWKIVLALRLSPVPFAIQNYLLALGHARWRTYLGLSMLIQGAIGLAVMLVGTSILTGGLGYIIATLCALFVLHLVLDTLRKRLTRDRTLPAQ